MYLVTKGLVLRFFCQNKPKTKGLLDPICIVFVGTIRLRKMLNMTKSKKKRHCEACGKELVEDEVHELDGMILCEDCYDEEEDLRAIEEEWVE